MALSDVFFFLCAENVHANKNNKYISSKKAKFETIFVRGKECLIHPDAVLLA